MPSACKYNCPSCLFVVVALVFFIFPPTGAAGASLVSVGGRRKGYIHQVVKSDKKCDIAIVTATATTWALLKCSSILLIT